MSQPKDINEQEKSLKAETAGGISPNSRPTILCMDENLARVNDLPMMLAFDAAANAHAELERVIHHKWYDVLDQRAQIFRKAMEAALKQVYKRRGRRGLCSAAACHDELFQLQVPSIGPCIPERAIHTTSYPHAFTLDKEYQMACAETQRKDIKRNRVKKVEAGQNRVNKKALNNWSRSKRRAIEVVLDKGLDAGKMSRHVEPFKSGNET